MSSDAARAERPHLAMLVANPVIGDSRVEKSAASAVRAGYRVTIVGVGHPGIPLVAQFENLPSYRIPLGFTRHTARVTEDKRRAAGAGERGPAPAVLSRLSRPLTRRFHTARKAWRLRRPGGWRAVWPQTRDYEEAFLEVLRELEPDLVHVHDRHPMAGAAAYAALRKAEGAPVPWVYDAHEWVPGTIIGGPPEAKAAWVALEAELIRTADAVITVTEHVAGELHRRHRLGARPRIAINAPRGGRRPLPPDQRRPLREECGLGPETPLLVYVGMLAEHRGVFTMVEALAELPGVHLAFVGSPSPTVRRQLYDRAVALGVRDRLHLLDYVPSASVTWYIESATCGVSALTPNPAHEIAMPTKLREYAQAGLPVIASDLATQSAFVTEHGVGTLFEAGDASSLAAAFHRLMADRQAYRRAVADPDFLAAQTWEGNEPALTATWHGLCPVPESAAADRGTAADAPARRAPSLVVVGSPADEPWAQAWSRLAGDARRLPGTAAGEDGGPSIPEGLATWLEIDRQADAVLHAGLSAAHGRADGGPQAEMASLRHRGRPVGVLTEAYLMDADRLRERPGHALADWDPEVFGRYRRQSLRRARPFLALLDDGVPVFSPLQRNAAMIEGVRWVPTPLPVRVTDPGTPPGSRGPVSLLIVPTIRSQAENRQLDVLVERAGQAGITVHRPRASRYDPAQARHADIIIDALTLGEWGLGAAHAWAASRLVIGHHDEALRAGTDPLLSAIPDPPVVESTVEDLVETVLDLARDLDGEVAGRARRRGPDFADSVHGGKMSVAGLRGVWNV